MKLNRATSNANKIKIVALNPSEQSRRIEAAIAKRAYEIFEKRGGTGWHELEDWRQAESEVRSKLCFGLTRSNTAFLIGCNAARFEDGSVEIWIAPKQIAICGKLAHPADKRSNLQSQIYRGTVYRVIAFPVEVRPDQVVANLKHNFLEIRLPIAQTTQPGVRVKQAA